MYLIEFISFYFYLSVFSRLMVIKLAPMLRWYYLPVTNCRTR